MTLLSDVAAGLQGHAEVVVTADDTAAALSSGDVPLLGTSRVVALSEQAATAAVRGTLPDGWTAVIVRVRIDHLAPSAVGTKVSADALLESVEGRRLNFTVGVFDPAGLVAAGKLTLVAVDRSRFLDRVH